MRQRQVLVQIKVLHSSSEQQVRELVNQLMIDGFEWDSDYLVPFTPPEQAEKEKARYRFLLLRGRIEEGRESILEALPNVVRIWSDPSIEPMSFSVEEESNEKAPPKNPFTF